MVRKGWQTAELAAAPKYIFHSLVCKAILVPEIRIVRASVCMCLLKKETKIKKKSARDLYKVKVLPFLTLLTKTNKPDNNGDPRNLVDHPKSFQQCC